MASSCRIVLDNRTSIRPSAHPPDRPTFSPPFFLYIYYFFLQTLRRPYGSASLDIKPKHLLFSFFFMITICIDIQYPIMYMYTHIIIFSLMTYLDWPAYTQVSQRLVRCKRLRALSYLSNWILDCVKRETNGYMHIKHLIREGGRL